MIDLGKMVYKRSNMSGFLSEINQYKRWNAIWYLINLPLERGIILGTSICRGSSCSSSFAIIIWNSIDLICGIIIRVIVPSSNVLLFLKKYR